jgi:hypothetical protein
MGETQNIEDAKAQAIAAVPKIHAAMDVLTK